MTTLLTSEPTTWPTVEDEWPWQTRALCAQVAPDVWFPDKTDELDDDAKATCRRCEVRGECLSAALARDERWGIWGGLTTEERDALVKPAAA